MSKFIIHISDTHFGDPLPTFNFEHVKKALIQEINKLQGAKILIISGDVTFKAAPQGYKDAEAFFNDVIKSCSIPRTHVLACPGNHDIATGSAPFNNFDSFLYSLRRDHEITFSKNTSTHIKIEGLSFLLVNSAAHCNHTYGLIPDSAYKILSEKEQEFLTSEKRIIVTHHHLIGQMEDDTSTSRNAYSFLYNTDKVKFDYILHGHQHSKLDLVIGKSGMRILSARSMSFHGKGYSNGLNIIEVDSNEVTSLIWTPDEVPGSLTAGVFK
ncbi:metallophosphoesterase [Pseudomonas sp. R16(2017)]|uniref:metallophosphoesterase family protein n=1 Tax=Pseudomonas sp. R16(2017) TaxID=1981704 RepID=UPI000A1DF63B|nr:metallophosphoesterase [Pseudomonas sp. R16(2017)]